MHSEDRCVETAMLCGPHRAQDAQTPARPPYAVPSVLSYTDQEILEQLGPAQTVLSGGHGREMGERHARHHHS